MYTNYMHQPDWKGKTMNDVVTAKANVNKQLHDMVKLLRSSSETLMPSIDVLGDVHSMSRANPEHVAKVTQATEQLETFCRLSYGCQTSNFPDEFWRSSEGLLLAEAETWLYGDDFITTSEAAMLLFDLKNVSDVKGSHRVRMSTWLHENPPRLREYHAPNRPYKQRVRKSDVLLLKKKLGDTK